MKGLTHEQLQEVVDFVQKHHAFAYIKDEDRINGELGYHIKYIDACYDSRDRSFWSIRFRGLGRNIELNTNNTPAEFSYFRDFIMAYLNYKWEISEDREAEFTFKKSLHDLQRASR